MTDTRAQALITNRGMRQQKREEAGEEHWAPYSAYMNTNYLPIQPSGIHELSSNSQYIHMLINMPSKLEFVQPTEYLKVITAERYAFENPLQPIFKLYAPIINNDRAKAISDAAEKAQKTHEEQASTSESGLNTEITWLKVVHSNGEDSKNEIKEEILAGAEWIIHKENTTTPESIKQDIQSLASRHPEGGACRFAEQAFAALRAAEAEVRANFPDRKGYMSLGSCFTVPEYRGRGLGHLLMEWGLNKADEMRLDIWIEAAPSAVLFYERHGFSRMKTFELDLACPDDILEEERVQWEAARDSILPVTAIFMCRFVGKDV